MPTALKTSLPKELMKRKIPSYVHTINVNKEANYLINKLGVSEIYTDFLTPKRL
jgi:glycerophosphoryl diester phosphodiesterase